MTPIPSPREAAKRGGRARRRGAAAAVAGLALAASLYGLGPRSAAASSHREAPLVAADPAIDNTDFYAFTSPDKSDTVTFISNWIPFQEPNGGPNFFPFATDASYIVNVDNDGDAVPDVRFRWTFKNIDRRTNNTFLYNDGVVTSIDDKNLLFRQVYTLEKWTVGDRWKTLVKDAPVAPSRVGKASMPDYRKLRDQAALSLNAGVKSFAGQADDPFFADLRVFDLLYGANLSETGQDTLAGYNVNTIALQVRRSDLALKGDAARNPIIGAWATAERARVQINGFDGNNNRASDKAGWQPGGRDNNNPNRYDDSSRYQDKNHSRNSDVDGYRANRDNDQVQVSRLGNPLVNEVVLPAGLKDAFNSLSPDKDAKIKEVVDRVLYPEIPKLVQGIYKIQAPPGPRQDLAEIFLTGITTKAGGPIKADLNSQLNNVDVNANRFVASEQLRLNMSVGPNKSPNRLGVLGGDLQGFPNGRRLGDDVIDIALQAMEGAAASGTLVDALAAGDKVNTNDRGFEHAFPYLALPNADGVNTRGSVAAPEKKGFFGFGSGYAGSAPMAVGGLAALVALGGFMVSRYRLTIRRRRDEPAVAPVSTTSATIPRCDDR
ncbi:DUF4331 domain-containing protein [Planosporangium flavigriseum]|uniref:DUF4331 domain-containing protein n=1 Tax=Planosporangium flavigriseum TaxID=373681 RepID=A0A8J3LP42_9ACTN|nr:DUF4331 domain-containing protein [Planosporangium flavigriseum]NJC66782.1 DUF4331 domain-containing protein [Planosporangium flavigriseum]GIG76272.1 hypothetical protein Pfl04_46760 [Planosporangium flavigriseum]